jgi:uncharacterized protein (TIGR00369 family)
MDEMLALGQQVLESQSFSRMLGTRLTVFAEGQAELCLAITPDMLQQHGYVHGGVLSYAADNALTFAGGSVLGPRVLTAEYKINYLRPARGGELIARASVIGSGTRQAVCRCDLWTVSEAGEVLCATALGTIVTVPETRA